MIIDRIVGARLDLHFVQSYSYYMPRKVIAQVLLWLSVIHAIGATQIGQGCWIGTAHLTNKIDGMHHLRYINLKNK